MALVRRMSCLMRTLGVCLTLHVSVFAEPLIECLDYSPYREGQFPGSQYIPTTEQIVQDVALLKQYAASIRGYGIDNNLARLPDICDSLAMPLQLGVWLVANDQVANDATIDKLVSILRHNHPSIRSVIIGTESIYRGDITVEQLIEYIKQVKTVSTVPVSAGETFYQYLASPALSEAVDFILYHCYPFWEGISLQEAPQYIINAHDQLKNKYPVKELVLGETGWPSMGSMYRNNTPGDDAQFVFFSTYLQLAHENHCRYMLFEAFDEPWKTSEEADFAAHWGFFDKDRNPKPILNRLDAFIATSTAQPSIMTPEQKGNFRMRVGTETLLPVYDAVGRIVGNNARITSGSDLPSNGLYLVDKQKLSIIR